MTKVYVTCHECLIDRRLCYGLLLQLQFTHFSGQSIVKLIRKLGDHWPFIAFFTNTHNELPLRRFVQSPRTLPGRQSQFDAMRTFQ
jgi:hypothetical protein